VRLIDVGDVGLLGEILTWVGVGVASLLAWALYAVGENAPRNRVRSEEQSPEE
jgi:hypothetical protein